MWAQWAIGARPVSGLLARKMSDTASWASHSIPSLRLRVTHSILTQMALYRVVTRVTEHEQKSLGGEPVVIGNAAALPLISQV